jgi:hypothetical protein
VLGEFVPVSIILRFRLRQKLDEFGRLPDAVQTGITLVARNGMTILNTRFVVVGLLCW